MPGFDKTGPMGDGPMTGRKMGRCTNYGQRKPATESADRADDNSTPDIPRRGDGFGPGTGGAGRRRGLGRQNRLRGRF